MEKRPPLTRQAFQPSRSRLLQPNQLFKPTRPTSPSDSPETTPTPKPQTSEPIPRIPRLPSKPSKLSTPPNSTKLANTFKPPSSQTPPRFAPFLSKSIVKPSSFPLRSANQPILQTVKKPLVLKSKNQPVLQSLNTPAASEPPKQTLTNTASIEKPTQPFQPPTVNTKTALSPPVLSSSQPHSTGSANSHQSHITPQNAPQKAASTPDPPAGSVQQQQVPYPLTTLRSHVLEAMSQSERKAFIAGWDAGWDAGWGAHAQAERKRKNHASTLTVSPAPSNILSPNQNCPSKIQHRSPPPPASSSVRSSPSVVPTKLPSSGTSGSTTRRKLLDPYAEDDDKQPHTVGPSKRPRTSPTTTTNPNTRPNQANQNPRLTKPPPPMAQKFNPRSIVATPTQSAPSAHLQNGNTESLKRRSGLDAYRARGKLANMQSLNVAFAAATTSDPVEFQRKKRKRSTSDKLPEPRRPVDTRTRQEPRRSVETRSQKESRRPVDTRTRQDPRRPVETRTRQDPRRPVEITPRPQPTQAISTKGMEQTRSRQEPRRPVGARAQQEPRRPVETRTRQDPRRPIEVRPRLEPRRSVELRPRPQPTRATSTNAMATNAKSPSWLKKPKCNGDERVPKAATTSNADSRQKPNSLPAKNSVTTSAQRAQPTPTNKSIPPQQNSMEVRKQSFPRATIENGSRCDLDMVRSSQEAAEEEESGWGSALNAAATREQLPIRSPSATATGKHPTAPGSGAGKPQGPLTGKERDPRRRQRVQRSVETEATIIANRLAEKERDDIAVQAYAERFGLVIVERDRESGKVEWVACKFCPVFGCRTRDPEYIMAHRAPFSLKKFLAHLEKDHCVKWKEYKLATAEEKGQFFSGKVLPAKAFHDRVAELKRSQDGMARRRVMPGVTAEEENARLEAAAENLAKQEVTQRSPTVVIDTTDECWIGRDRFRDRSSNGNVSVSQRLPTARSNKLPSLERMCKCFKELEISSEIAGLILHGIVKDNAEEEWADNDRGFTDTIVLDGDEMRPTTLIFSSADEATASRVASALRYLYRGMGGSICMTLLQDNRDIQAGITISYDTGREVLGHGNALMALGMHILTRALASDWRSWGIGLTTRSCRYVRGGAVEVLISIYDGSGEMRKTHLITVLEVSGAGAAVIEVLDVILPSWKRRLLGLHSGICKQTETYEKQIETAIVGDVRKSTERELVLVEHGVRRDDNPMFPWALSKMCESKFEALMSKIAVPLGIALGPARMRAAKAQRLDIFRRVLSGGSEREAFHEAWKVAGERAAEICVVAEGLQAIWACDCEEDEKTVAGEQRREQGKVVDSDAERVLWARALVGLWNWCGRIVKELGMDTPRNEPQLADAPVL